MQKIQRIAHWIKNSKNSHFKPLIFRVVSLAPKPSRTRFFLLFFSDQNPTKWLFTVFLLYFVTCQSFFKKLNAHKTSKAKFKSLHQLNERFRFEIRPNDPSQRSSSRLLNIALIVRISQAHPCFSLWCLVVSFDLWDTPVSLKELLKFGVVVGLESQFLVNKHDVLQEEAQNHISNRIGVSDEVQPPFLLRRSWHQPSFSAHFPFRNSGTRVTYSSGMQTSQSLLKLSPMELLSIATWILCSMSFPRSSGLLVLAMYSTMAAVSEKLQSPTVMKGRLKKVIP